MLIPLSQIRENGNMRRVPASPTAEESLRRSIEALGVLEPVLVRHDPEGVYLLIAGYRRVSVARSLGLTEIPAEVKLFTDAEADMAQAAENMVRVDPDPVDRWRHICRLVDDGYSMKSAGAALGLSDRAVGQLSKLGRLAPAVLDELVGRSLPPQKTLGEIAQAPHDRQVEAMERHRWSQGIQWNSVAAECIQSRVSRSYAIFDVETSGITFDEDFFAEPGSPEQFTTTELLDFMSAQRDAVEEKIRTGKEPAILTEYDPVRALPKLPAGWTFADFGDARTLTKRSRQKRVYAIIPATEYRDGGKVISILAKEISAKATESEPEGDDDDPYYDESATPQADQAEESEPADGDGITRAGHDLLSSVRLEALKARLRVIYADSYAGQIMASLIIKLVGNNYTCRDLIAALVSPDGQEITRDIEVVAAIGAEALARTVEMWPKHNHTAHGRAGETQCSEWIGTLVEADMGMPRLDTPEMLAHVSGDGLKKIASDFLDPDTPPRSIPKKVGDLRHFLAGKAEGWAPVHFGAPGPNCEPWSPAAEDDDENGDA